VHASGVKETADRLLAARDFQGCAQCCAEALELEPDNLDLRLLRARALMALGRDNEATKELGRILRWHPGSNESYRLLGQLAVRRGKLGAAGTFLEHAARLAPEDQRVQDLLELVQSSLQPTVAVEKLPAATATVGCSLFDPQTAEATAPAQPRVKRLAAGSQAELPTREEPAPAGIAQRFGRYLVAIGALTPRQLRAALDYQRHAGIRLGAAAVALGFLSEPSVEWAAHDFHTARQAC
jgi:tetratricopeptide (TPR) repeat protein